MKTKKIVFVLLVAFAFTFIFAAPALAVYGGGGGGGYTPPAPTANETDVSTSASTAADIEANNNIKDGKAEVATDSESLYKTFSLDFINAVNSKLDSISFGVKDVEVILPAGALDKTAADNKDAKSNETVIVEVKRVPVTQTQQNAGSDLTVIAAVEVNITVVHADGSRTRIDQLGGPVTIEMNVEAFLAAKGLKTEAEKAAYINENNVMIAFITPAGAVNYYPVTYSNNVIRAEGVTHFSTYAAVEANKVRVVRMTIDKLNTKINNNTRIIDVPPMIIDSRTMVPLRFIGEALEGKVDWTEATRTVEVTLGNKTVSLVIGQTGPGLDVPAQIVDSRTLVPVRYISEQLGAKVNWDEITRIVEIIK